LRGEGKKIRVAVWHGGDKGSECEGSILSLGGKFEEVGD